MTSSLTKIDMMDDPIPFIRVKKQISKNGHSLTLNVTWEVKALGLDHGDEVIVILRRPDAEKETAQESKEGV